MTYRGLRRAHRSGRNADDTALLLNRTADTRLSRQSEGSNRKLRASRRTAHVNSLTQPPEGCPRTMIRLRFRHECPSSEAEGTVSETSSPKKKERQVKAGHAKKVTGTERNRLDWMRLLRPKPHRQLLCGGEMGKARTGSVLRDAAASRETQQ